MKARHAHIEDALDFAAHYLGGNYGLARNGQIGSTGAHHQHARRLLALRLRTIVNDYAARHIFVAGFRYFRGNGVVSLLGRARYQQPVRTLQ